jgi:hypothetical protein
MLAHVVEVVVVAHLATVAVAARARFTIEGDQLVAPVGLMMPAASTAAAMVRSDEPSGILAAMSATST